jgi:hypothetical protein
MPPIKATGLSRATVAVNRIDAYRIDAYRIDAYRIDALE